MSDLARHLEAAQGYLELGMPVEASEELECIAPEERDEPAVLSYRYAIYSMLKKWVMAEVVARHLVKVKPEEPEMWINWAYATRRAESIEAARKILLEAEAKHPEYPLIHFNLGCYACQLGDMAEAKRRVSSAIHLDAGFRALALDDPDLEPLWDELAGILKEN